MGLAERIKIIFDVDDAPGVKGLKSIRTEMANAEGVTGKLKAGFKGMGDMLAQNAGPIALAAGAALVTFGIKAVGAFERTAKAAIDMGAAVGMGTENASRWIAVGDDMGVSADKLTAAFGKVGKSLDSGMWEKYGIATRDASGQVRTTNDIVLDAFDTLGKITNQTERAKAGNDLFGKGYQNLAPMIGKTRAEMEKYLGSVEDGQVITDKEAEKAERMRLAQDKLHDALNEVTMATGEFVAELAPAVEGVADFISWVVKARGATQDWARDLAGLGDDIPLGIGHITNAQKEASDGAADWSRVLDDFSDGTAADFKRSLDKAKDAAEKLDDAMQTLKGHIDERQAWRNAAEEVQKMHDMIAEGGHTWGEYADQADAATLAVADVVEQMKNVPAEAKASLIVALENGDLDAVNAAIEVFKRGFTVPLRAVFIPPKSSTLKGLGGGMVDESQLPGNARGTDMSPGGRTIVGEEGPEIVDLPRGARVYPAHETRQMLMGAGAAGSTGSSGEGITMHTTVQIMGNVFGVDDLDARVQRAVDERDRRLMQTLAAGVRK